MKNLFSFLMVFLSPVVAYAGQGGSQSLDDQINALFQPITDALSQFIFYSVPIGNADVPLIVCWLILAAFFFTVYLGFINIRGFGHAIDIVRRHLS